MKFLKSFTLALLAVLLWNLPVSAQNRVVYGKVLDTGQHPLEGVAVMVKGTSNGTMTEKTDNSS